MANKTIDLRKIKHELRGKGRDESRRHARKSESAPHGGRFSRYHYNKAPGATPAVKELPDSEYQTSDKEPEDNKSPKDRGIETGRQSSAKQEFDHEGAESHSVALFHWEAMEFEHSVEKNLNLFLLGIILIITSVVTIFFRNFTFAALLLISGGLVMAQAFKLPRKLTFFVSPRGVKVGQRIYEFEDLKSFWLFYDPPDIKELSLKSRKQFMPLIKAPLGDVDPLLIREVLLRFLKEEKHEESLVEIISRQIGF